MLKRFLTSSFAAAVLVLAAGPRVGAHEGHEHKILGTVTMAAADHLMLKDRGGQDVMVKVTTATKVNAKPSIKVEEIKPGTRVVVTAVEEKDKSLTAKIIDVGTASAPSN